MWELDDCLNAGVLEKDFTSTAVQVCRIAVCMHDVCEGWTVKHLSKIRPVIQAGDTASVPSSSDHLAVTFTPLLSMSMGYTGQVAGMRIIGY